MAFRQLLIIFSLLVSFLAPVSVRAQEREGRNEEFDYKTHPENAPGEVDPRTGIYYPKDSIWWQVEKQRREDEYFNDLKRSSELGMSLTEYEQLKQREEREFKVRKLLTERIPIRPSVVDPILALRRKAVSLSEGKATSIVTFSWSLDERNDYLVQVKEGGTEVASLNVGDGKKLEVLNGFMTRSKIVFIEGEIPDHAGWHHWLSNICKQCVILSKDSGNRSVADKTFAALLGRVAVEAENVTAYNALPYETDKIDSLRERLRMRIKGSREKWLAANDRITEALGSPGPQGKTITSSLADKDTVLKDLHEGSSNLVLIFAHSDGKTIYMPGKNGSRVTVQDLRAIARNTAPDRVVVLIACEAGTVNDKTESLAGVILKSKLARTVFAYPGLISPSYVPQVIERLRSGLSPRSALPGLNQIVTIEEKRDEFSSTVHSRPGF
jgi:hypothetical protein